MIYQKKQRDNYSIIPPASSYFKVDEPSVQPDHIDAQIQTPVQNKVAEVGESQEKLSKDSLIYSDNKESNKKVTKQKFNKWEDDEESQQSRNSPVVYPYPGPYQHPMIMPTYPANIQQIYKTPDGKLLVPVQSVQLANKLQRKNDIREERSDR